MTAALLDPPTLDALRTSLDGYTVDGVHDLLGPVGRAAQERGDLDGVDRALPPGERLSTLVRLFLLGVPVAEHEARGALGRLDPAAATPLLERSAGAVRARAEIRPYGTANDADVWWVVSDFGSDVRPGPLAADHVLGIGAASLTLAQATPRRRGDRALDLGTGCGVQALHLARQARSVVATDVSARALRMAATTAALSGQRWELRAGSLLEPVAAERFDVIVANPPFVVSPGLRRGAGGYDYRDSGLAGDAVSAALLRGLPGLLAPGGTASVLVNWIVPADGDWAGRVGLWLADTGCDAWVWQREVLDPGAYTTLWLWDSGERPGTPRWTGQYRAWLDWFAAADVAAVGMGLATLRRTGRAHPTVVCEDVRQAVEQPAGPAIDAWFGRQAWLADVRDDALLASTLKCADSLVRTRHDLRAADGWRTELSVLRQGSGLRWEIEVDDAVSGVVAACDGTVPLAVPVAVLAAAVGRGITEVGSALLPVVRDLVSRGFLEPVNPAPRTEGRRRAMRGDGAR